MFNLFNRKPEEDEHTPRVPCSKCNSMILPITAEKTGGLCMPCSQKEKKAEQDKFIEENKKDVNLYEGITDPVEIIKIMHQKLKHDPLINYIPYPKPIEEIYRNLNKQELTRLLTYAVEGAESGATDLIDYMCLEIAAFKNPDLSELQKYLVGKSEYYPSMLFKRANGNIVNHLLEQLDNDDENRNHILLALAWAGDNAVVEQFVKWYSNPPEWAENLYIPPQDYLMEAGWIINDKKEKKFLYLDKCFPLLANKNNEVDGPLSIGSPSGKSCKWCNRKFTKLFEFDLKDPLFDFIPFSGDKLTITTCDVCSAYVDPLFMEITPNGEVSWSDYNKKPDYLPDDSDTWGRIPENCLIMSEQSRPADYAANEFLPTTFSQIGGMPTWIQDFAYPDCPKCNQKMIFIGQISNEDYDRYSEGIYYSYLCSECNITATNYQQT